MTQNDQVRLMLEAGWVCATEFLDEHIPRYGARIFELQQRGHLIRRRLCRRHQHQSRQFEWRADGFDAEGQGVWAVAG